EHQVAGLHRIGEAHLDAATLRAGHVRDAATRGTIACRVGQHHRRLEARHQPLVAVGGGVGERVDRLGVLEDAADVPQRGLAQAAVQVAGEQVLAVLRQRLVHVHAAAVVADQRLGHKVTVLSFWCATFFTTYFMVISSSAFFTRVLNLTPISHWPALATSWWCTSTVWPSYSSTLHMSARRSPSESTGLTGK